MGAIAVRGITEAEWDDLVACARGRREPDLVISGGTVLNVYSGELIEANVWVVGKHIAYVGPRQYEGDAATVIDATGKVVAPGYIEPHAHPFQLYNPITYAEAILARGTTCSVNDDLVLHARLEFGQVGRFFELTADLPIKMVWSVRLDPQTHAPQTDAKFSGQVISRLLKHPHVWQAGEVTDWKALIDGHPDKKAGALAAKAQRKRVEGHCAGMSYDNLNVLMAAGVTADHEAISSEEAMRRLRLGIWTTLRHSSLRPDLPLLLPGLLEQVKNWSRVMMTTDGPTPEYFEDGFSDFLVRKAIELGLDPITAYQLVTINPATYYGVDDEIGGIAPGRLADLLLLPELREPTPELVIAEGRVVARNGKLIERLPQPNWSEVGLPPLQPMGEVSPEWFDVYTTEATFPVMNLQNPAITRRIEMPVTTEEGRVVGLVENSDDLCYIALLSREGKWVCNGVIQSFATDLAGMATSYTGASEMVVIGRDKQVMAKAAERVLENGGGIVVMDAEAQVQYEMVLPIGGNLSTHTVEELAAECKELAKTMAAVGHPHYDPIYTFLFLSSTHLPELRLTTEGLYEVKTRRIVHPSRSL